MTDQVSKGKGIVESASLLQVGDMAAVEHQVLYPESLDGEAEECGVMVRGRPHHLAIQLCGATFRSTRGTTMASGPWKAGGHDYFIIYNI